MIIRVGPGRRSDFSNFQRLGNPIIAASSVFKSLAAGRARLAGRARAAPRLGVPRRAAASATEAATEARGPASPIRGEVMCAVRKGEV